MADDLFLRNFRTSNTAGGTDPVTEFKKGDTISFQWDSNGDTFHLYANSTDTSNKPLNTDPAASSCSATAPAMETTYLVSASRSDNPEKLLYATIHITIVPAPAPLVASSIDNLGDEDVTGSLTGSNALFNGSLNVQGPLGIFGHYVHVKAVKNPTTDLPFKSNTALTDGYLLVQTGSKVMTNNILVEIDPSQVKFLLSARNTTNIYDRTSTLPIQKGQTYTISYQGDGNFEGNIFWIPMGPPSPANAKASAAIGNPPDVQERQAGEWIDSLAEAFQQEFDPELRRSLLSKTAQW
jgi:hypothetical protein